MAYPLACVAAIFGSQVGYRNPCKSNDQLSLHCASFIGLFLVVNIGDHLNANDSLGEVVAAVEIAAPSSVVWQNVIAFSELEPASEMILGFGIAYPRRARLEGIVGLVLV